MRIIKYLKDRKFFIPLQGLGVLLFFFSSFDIFVSPTGNDQNSGSFLQPKATLTAAVRQAREMRRLHVSGIEQGINIVLAEGTYSLYETLNLRPEDSGTKQSPTTICGAEGKKVIVSGGQKITNWKKSGKLLVADVPDFNGRPFEFRQLWVNGRKAIRARDVADFSQMYRIIRNDKVQQILWVPTKAVKKILHAPYPEMVLHQMWAVSFLRIKSIEVHGDSAAVRFQNPESRLQFERPWPQPVVGNDVNSPFYLTNAKELLDEPGEWYLDLRAHKVYYYPLPGEIVTEAIAPVLESLVSVSGTLERPVHDIFFKNITFSHSAWNRPSSFGHVPLQASMYMTEAYKLRPSIDRENNHKLDNQGWLGRPTAAVEVQSAENVSFDACVFEHIGASGLDYVEATKSGAVNACLFRDIAGNGVVTGSFSPESHETHLPYIPEDKRVICDGLTISNNLLTDVTNEDWGCVGILAGYVKNCSITHNEINNVSYSGISVGWGWNRDLNEMKNNKVFANNIHHYAKHMYDVAGIYTLGAQPGTVITENWIHDIYRPAYAHDPFHWFYLYTDEGSSYITVKNNKVPAPKFLQNANGPSNVWENNSVYVADSISEKSGIQFSSFNPATESVTDISVPLQEIPAFAAFDFVSDSLDTDRLLKLTQTIGIIAPGLYSWKNHTVLYAQMNHVQDVLRILQSNFKYASIRMFDKPLYNFDLYNYTSGKATVSAKQQHILFTANLVDDKKMQQEYVNYHNEQYERWPEVAQGFCNAGFTQLQVFRNERQLLLVITIPENKTLDELNPKTTENNPRMDDWNKLMRQYQVPIEGAAENEVWVRLK